jgi:hypothetical protein
MVEPKSAEDRLARLRELVMNARSMPMSASCVINRHEALEAIDDVLEHLPDEFAQAQRVIDEAQARVAEGEAEAARIIAEARSQVSQLAEDSEVVEAAVALAASIKAEAETEAEALRRETDVFIDARMASFESVLHKTTSQVRTARARLSERSALDERVR